MKDLNLSIIKEYKENIRKTNNTIVIDIDGVVATKVEGTNYHRARPIKKNIGMINSLKKAGMKIIFFTARGSETGKNWENLTKKQFAKWGIY